MIPAAEPAPAAVEHRHAARAREGDRQAVGGEDQRRQAGLGGDLAVDLGHRRAGSGERARVCGSRWIASSAPWTWRPISDPLGVEAEGGCEPAPVLDHGAGLVIGQVAEVEAVEGRLADPAEPGSRRRPARPAARASSHSISPLATPLHRSLPRPRAPPRAPARGPAAPPSSLSRSAAARPRPTAGPSGTPAAIRSAPSISSETSRHSSRYRSSHSAPIARARTSSTGSRSPAAPDRLRRPLRARRRQPLGPLGRPEGGGEDRLARAARRPPRAGRRAARRRRRRARGRPSRRSTRPHCESRARPRTASGSAATRRSSASRRSAETVSRSASRSSASVSGSSSNPNRAA